MTHGYRLLVHNPFKVTDRNLFHKKLACMMHAIYTHKLPIDTKKSAPKKQIELQLLGELEHLLQMHFDLDKLEDLRPNPVLHLPPHQYSKLAR